jgi:hypothetical protein
MATISDMHALAIREGWIEPSEASALYVSAGADTKPMALLHPDFLARQGASSVKAPSFFVYVDQDRPASPDDQISFEDERTKIETTTSLPQDLEGHQADLLRVSLASDVLSERDVVILRVRMLNEDFAQFALAEGWSADWFIGVCDGCGAFGGNSRCENALVDPNESIPLRLGSRWWVTDHLPGSDAPTTRSGGATDLANDQAVRPKDLAFDLSLRQIAFLSTDWRSNVADTTRLYGGARVFGVERGR